MVGRKSYVELLEYSLEHSTRLDDEVLLSSHSKVPNNRRTSTEKRGRKRKKKSNNTACENVEFDSRYFYLDARQNFQKNSQNQIRRNSQQILVKIPDDETGLRSKTRIGPSYQAKLGEDDSPEFADSNYFIGYTMWDPQKAAEAERNGQDIDSFLNIDSCELVKKEMLMTLLHHNNYNVAEAKFDYCRLLRFGGEPTSKLTRKQASDFQETMQHQKKDFVSIARKMKRTKSDCMIHYYSVYKRTKEYTAMKKEWKSDFCANCNDGGDLILCDGCERAYHKNCLPKGQRRVPRGQWLCPRCQSCDRTQSLKIALGDKKEASQSFKSTVKQNPATFAETSADGEREKEKDGNSKGWLAESAITAFGNAEQEDDLHPDWSVVV